MKKNSEEKIKLTKSGKEPVLLRAAHKGHIEEEMRLKDTRNGKRRYKFGFRVRIQIDGTTYRHRSNSRKDCEDWIEAISRGDIHPTDNKADWWRMEQRKDETVRNDEIIISQAEEATLLYNYHQTKDISPINDYIVQRLLPHMAYYCSHTLHLSEENTMTASRQAIALLLTRVTSGRPVIGLTITCKRMLRVYKQRGDFFYYEKAPEDVKYMVNNLDLSGLAKMWKLVRDRRL